MADRAHGIANTVDTRFGIASGAKGFTALVVVSLAVDGMLPLDTTGAVGAGRRPAADRRRRHGRAPARRIARASATTSTRTPAARSPTTCSRCRPHRLVDSEDYLQVLDGFPTKFAAGTDFSYCNGWLRGAGDRRRACGSGVPFHELVRRACDRAGGHGRHRVPAQRRAARRRRPRLPADRRPVAHERVPPAGAGQRRRRASPVRRPTCARFWPALYAGRDRAGRTGSTG